MNTNKILLGAVAGGITYFLLGWLVYGTLLKDFTQSYPELKPETVTDIMRNPMVMWAMALGCLVYGLFLAIVMGRWASISTFAAGAKAGAIIGLLWAFASDLMMYSMFKTMSLNAVFIDPLIAGVLSAITGGVVGW
ncbi:MAG: hypothetical protein AAB316_12525, partial [Bacteroidota bacterium]